MTDILGELRKIRDGKAREAELVTEARAAGVAWVDICAATGLSRQTLNVMVRKANEGILPGPRIRAVVKSGTKA